MVSLLLICAIAAGLSVASAAFAADYPQSPSATKTSRKASLLFQGDVSVLSNPLPEDVTPSQLDHFLRKKETLIAFASGGEADDDRPREVAITPQWESVWKKYCVAWYGQEYFPKEGDCIFAADTWTNFPGLRLCTTVYTGVKVITNQSNNIPSYCFLAIGQSQTARGLPPIVWCFHRIMGTKPRDVPVPVESMKPSGPVKSIYCVEKSNDGCLCFRLDSSFQFKIEFPAALLKVLPTSRAKAEKQGSAALSKTISKAAKRGIESGYKAFLAFRNQQTNRGRQTTAAVR